MTCSYCAKSFEKENKTFKDICFDGYSKDHLFEQLDQIFEMCPHCGIVTDDLTRDFNDKICANIVKNEFAECKEYQEILKNNTIDKLEKKLLLAEIAADKTHVGNGRHNSDMDLTWFVYYHSKGLNDKAKTYFDNKRKKLEFIIENRKAYDNIEEITSDVLDGCKETMLELIDMYRQLGDFTNAIEYINILKTHHFTKYSRNAKIKLKIQEKLCKKKDCSRVLKPKIKDSTDGIIY